jgi:orotate phosphoribosyltransferase
VRFSELAGDETALRTISGWLATVIAPWQPTAVVAPVTAGVALGSALADDLRCGLALAAVDDQGRADTVLDVDLDFTRTLLVNDVVTTGTGLVALERAAHAAGAEQTVAAAFMSRTADAPGGAYDGPLGLVGVADLPSWPEDQCTLCRRGIELEDGLDLN